MKNNALTREDVIGKEFYINSTNYYNGELFEAGKSMCDGAEADLGRLRFQSSREGRQHMNLGAALTRSRSQVFDTPFAVASFMADRYARIENSEKRRLPGGFHSLDDFPLLLVGKNQETGRVYVQHACLHEDEWTGAMQTRVYGGPSGGMAFQAVQLGQPFSIQVGNSINECAVVGTIDEAIERCVAFMGDAVRQFELDKNVREMPTSDVESQIAEARATSEAIADKDHEQKRTQGMEDPSL